MQIGFTEPLDHTGWGTCNIMGLDAFIILMRDLTPEERGLWQEWQRARPQLRSPFFNIGFSDAVACEGSGVAVAKLYEAGRLIGFFPYQRRGRTAYPVGAPMNDYHAVIGDPQTRITLEDVARLLPVKRLSVNSWVGPDNGNADDRYLRLSTCQANIGPDGYDAWFEKQRSQHNKYFKDKARSRRGMESAFGPMRVHIEGANHTLLDQLISLKSQQYRRTGRHDIFGPQWTRRLLHRLLDGDNSFKATLASLWAGDTLLAMELSLHADGVWHFWFPAYLETGAKYSPGIWLSMETMRQVCTGGYDEFDYGFSGEVYKKYFYNRSEQVVEAVIGGRDWTDLVRITTQRPDLALSTRRRWAAIEASEPQLGGRILGTILAGRSLVGRLARKESSK